MKKLLVIFGFISAILAVILAVTALYNLAVTPIIFAFVSVLGILYISKKQNTKTKTTQYIFLLVVIALSLTMYKAVFNATKIEDSKQLEQPNEVNIEDPKKLIENSKIK